MDNKTEEILKLQKEIVELDLAIQKLESERNKMLEELKEITKLSN